MAKISVIMPIYNAAAYLDECIQSLINQTLQDIEIILIDDGSKDDSLEICKKYAMNDSRIIVFERENVGQGIERNFGLKEATGEFVAFIDADDRYELSMLEKMYNCAKKYNADMVSCGHQDFDESGIITVHCQDKKIIDNEEEKIALMKDLISYKDKEGYYGCIAVWDSIFSKQIIEKFCIEFMSERIVYSEDLLFKLSFLERASKVIILDDVLYDYRVSTKSFSNTVTFQVIDRILLLYKIIRDRFSKLLNTEDLEIRNTNRVFCTIRFNMKKVAHAKNSILFYQEICRNQELERIIKNYKPTNIKNRLVLMLLNTKNKYIISFLLRFI